MSLSSLLRLTLVLLSSYLRAAHAQTQLSDGDHIEYGASGLPDGLEQWQASGILTKGCTESTGIYGCYNVTLSSDPNTNLDNHFPDSPRQRMEFRTFYHDADTGFYFTWKQYFPTSIGTATDESSFFHIMQIFNVDINYPVFTLDAFNNSIRIYDFAGDKCGEGCPSVPLEDYAGRTTSHNLGIKFGPSGWIDYTILDSDTGEEVLYYYGTGILGGNKSHLKLGFYRSTYQDMTPINGAVGDFSYHPL